jgi:hypothetical protein
LTSSRRALLLKNPTIQTDPALSDSKPDPIFEMFAGQIQKKHFLICIASLSIVLFFPFSVLSSGNSERYRYPLPD